MGTIKKYVLEKEITHLSERLKRLEEMGAPSAQIAGGVKILEDLKSGVLKVGGKPELLDLEAINPVAKKGSGGKVYIEFANGVKYFPNARYGRYITD